MATKKTKKQEVVTQEVVTEEIQVVENAPAVEEKPAKTKKAKVNKEKVDSAVKVLDNDTLLSLFHENGCLTRTHASNDSTTVYNTFGTQSRVLQQKRAYQLLLTNGHKSAKGVLVDTDNDDAARFTQWYDTLTDEQKKWVVGYSEMMHTKLSATEMPRERTVKITSYDLLVEFLKYMSSFAENQLVKAE